MNHGIAVMVKYPPGHHRHAVEADWHAWGDAIFDVSDPDLDDKVTLVARLARRFGCQVRIQRIKVH
mgnify:FL=1